LHAPVGRWFPGHYAHFGVLVRSAFLPWFR
jgi:hypothetical protein